MKRSGSYSIRLILMSWAVLALGTTAIAVAYFLFDAASSQFHDSWKNKIEYDLGVLQQQLQHSLAAENTALADRSVSYMATHRYITRVDVIQHGLILFSTDRGRIGAPGQLPAVLHNSRPLPDNQQKELLLSEQGNIYTAALPVYYQNGIRQQSRGLLVAWYNVQHEYHRMLIDLAQKLALLLGLILLYSLGLSQLLKRQVLAPLTRLQGFTQSLRQGELGQTLEQCSSREFTELGDTFNQLSRHLQLSIAQIERQNAVDRAFSRTFPDVAFLIDREGYIRERIGNQHSNVSELSRNLTGQPAWGWIEHGQADSVRACWLRAISQESVVIESLQHQDRYLESRMTPFRLERSDGQGVDGVFWLIRDVTELRLKQQEVEYRAHYDTLTRLSNREMALGRVREHLSAARKCSRFGALLFIDLDHFKNINDSLGHPVGDAILQQAAERLRLCAGPRDLCARLGGDEFLLLPDELYSDANEAVDQATNFASALLEQFRQPFLYNRHSFHLSASIGISLFPFDQHTSSDLIRQADTAMYYAKAHGRNGWSLYSEHMQRETQSKLSLINDLHDAIKARAFSLAFQPQLDHLGRIIGAEVLCRWQHRGKPVPPDLFIAAAEEANLIVELGDWVLSASCQTLARLRQQHLLPQGFERLAINISPVQFLNANFFDQLVFHIEAFDIPPGLVELEITEGIFVNDKQLVKSLIQRLVHHGFNVSMDDFGTGYSSLSYLQSLPIQTLKIDRSFVSNINNSAADANIVDYIIQLGHSLYLDIVAEGVETEQQREYLLSHGCTKFQGYLFSKPLDETAFIEYLTPDSS